MDDAFHALMVLIGAAFACGVCGAAFAFGVALVCRSMKWAPVDLTVNLNDYRDL